MNRREQEIIIFHSRKLNTQPYLSSLIRRNMPRRINTRSAVVGSTLLPNDFRPTSNVVISGKGKLLFNHHGNVQFRALVQAALPAYAITHNKTDKTVLLSFIVDGIKSLCPGKIGFVRKDAKDGRWYELSEDAAREKVGFTLRQKSKRATKKCQQEGGLNIASVADLWKASSCVAAPPSATTTKNDRPSFQNSFNNFSSHFSDHNHSRALESYNHGAFVVPSQMSTIHTNNSLQMWGSSMHMLPSVSLGMMDEQLQTPCMMVPPQVSNFQDYRLNKMLDHADYILNGTNTPEPTRDHEDKFDTMVDSVCC